jgi:hypothetical protein
MREVGMTRHAVPADRDLVGPFFAVLVQPVHVAMHKGVQVEEPTL